MRMAYLVRFSSETIISVIKIVNFAHADAAIFKTSILKDFLSFLPIIDEFSSIETDPVLHSIEKLSLYIDFNNDVVA